MINILLRKIKIQILILILIPPCFLACFHYFYCLVCVLYVNLRYHKLLTPLSKDVDIWSTEYFQQLPHGGTAKQVLYTL